MGAPVAPGGGQSANSTAAAALTDAARNPTPPLGTKTTDPVPRVVASDPPDGADNRNFDPLVVIRYLDVYHALCLVHFGHGSCLYLYLDRIQSGHCGLAPFLNLQNNPKN